MTRTRHQTKRDQEPTVKDRTGPTDGQSFEHPAFGQVSVHRIQGSRTLYGSDFVHHNFVRIQVKRSTLERSLARDWHYGGDNLIEFDLSEAQWATFVSSFNQGSGVPCTLNWLPGEGLIPTIPLRESHRIYDDEAKHRVERSLERLRSLLKDVEENTQGLSKAKREALLEPIKASIQDLESNLPFVIRSFGEYMEHVVEQAKVEVHAYLDSSIRRAGLEALTQGQAPLELEHRHDGQD